MLTVNKNLTAKNICGKKYRSPAFTYAVIFLIPFVVLAVIASASVPEREGRAVIIGLIIVVMLSLPLALVWGSRKASYIINGEKLYFFDSQVKCLPSENRKKLRNVRTNGSLCFSDIKNFYYLGFKLEGFFRRRYIVPPRVVIIGDDFEVEIYAHKSLIKKIEEMNQLK